MFAHASPLMRKKLDHPVRTKETEAIMVLYNITVLNTLHVLYMYIVFTNEN